VPNVGGTYGMR